MGCDSNLRTYTFEQSKFKKEFAIMNQVFRQNAQINVEKIFYKLMNNSKFRYDCRNNTDNCTFAAIFDEIEKLSDAKQFQNVFDQESFLGRLSLSGGVYMQHGFRLFKKVYLLFYARKIV